MTGPATPRNGELTFTELVFSDLARYRPGEAPSWLKVLTRCLTQPGLIANLIVRGQQCLDRAGHGLPARMLRSVAVVAIGCDLGPCPQIGPGLYLPHPVGITFGNASTVLGQDVTLGQSVTLGARDPVENTRYGYPEVGDGAFILGGSSVLGGVTIGRHAIVAANSLVMRDVPDYGIVMGVPARLVGDRRDEVEGRVDEAQDVAPSEPPAT